MQRSPVVSSLDGVSHSRQARRAWARWAQRSDGGVFTIWRLAPVQPTRMPSVLLAVAASLYLGGRCGKERMTNRIQGLKVGVVTFKTFYHAIPMNILLS